MNKPTLFLHIGTPKTGTSTIQNSIYLNRDMLAQKGIWCPMDPYSGTRLFGSLAFRILNIRENIYPSSPEKWINQYMSQFSESGCENMLLSSESCYDSSAHFDEMLQWIKKYFSEFNIKIICYLRRQDFYLESFYNYSIKLHYDIFHKRERRLKVHLRNYVPKPEEYDVKLEKGDGPLSFRFFLIRRLKDVLYEKNISKWAAVFGKENIIIRPFEKCQLKDGLLNDFYINALNLKEDDISGFKPVEKVNESLSRDMLEFKLASGIHDIKLLYYIDSLLDNKTVNNIYFTHEERKRLMAFHEEGNSVLAKEYLGRKDGRLFYEDVEQYQEYQGLSMERAAEILDKTLPVLKHLYSDSPLYTAGTIYKDSSSFSSSQEIAGYVGKLYTTHYKEDYIKARVDLLFYSLAEKRGSLVIYGFHGKLASIIFELAGKYEKFVKIYVADRSLSSFINVNMPGASNILLPVINLEGIKASNPNAVIIAAALSGPAIKAELDKLELESTIIYPAYDFSARVWNEIE